MLGRGRTVLHIHLCLSAIGMVITGHFGRTAVAYATCLLNNASHESIERTYLMAELKHKLYKHEFIVESFPQSDFRHWLSSKFRAIEEVLSKM